MGHHTKANNPYMGPKFDFNEKGQLSTISRRQ